MPITFRNVANTVTGNPASALAGAASAFGIAGRGSQRLLENAVAQDERDQAALTNEALSSIFADGRFDESELQNLPAGTDIGAIMDRYNTQRKTGADVTSAEATARLRGLQADDLAFDATPEQRLRVKQREDASDALAQSNAENAAKRLEISDKRLQIEGATLEEQTRVRDGITNAEKLYNSEEPGGLRGEAVAILDQQWPGIIESFAGSNKIQSLAPAEQDAAIAQFESTARERYLGQIMNERQPEWQANLQSQLGLTRTQIGQTSFGHRGQQVEATTLARLDQENAAARKEVNDQAKAAQKVAKSNATHYMIREGDSYRVGTAGEAKSNKLSEAQLVNFLADDLNLRIDPDEIPRAQKILRKVGGNKDAFLDAVMSDDVDIDRDRGLFTIFGDDDDIDWDAADVRAGSVRTIMNGAAEALANPPTTKNNNFGSFRDVVSSIATSEADAATPPPAPEPETPVPLASLSSEDLIKALDRNRRAI